MSSWAFLCGSLIHKNHVYLAGSGLTAAAVGSLAAAVVSNNGNNHGSTNQYYYLNRTELEASTKPWQETPLKRRMTSIGHFSVLSETPQNPSIVTILMTLKTNKSNPWTIERFKDLWTASQMRQRHPRFHLVVQDLERGEFAERINKGGGGDQNDVEWHLSESLPPVTSRTDVLHRIKSLQTKLPFDLSEKLWHIYLVPWTKAGSSGTTNRSSVNESTSKKSKALMDEEGEALIFFQGHHALADGASMGAALLDLSDEAQEIRDKILKEVEKRGLRGPWWKRLYQQFLFVLWLVTGSLQSAWYQFRLHILTLFAEKSPWNILEQLYNAEHPEQVSDRSVSFTTVASVEQAKWVARTLGGHKTTVNDLFCTAVSLALARLLEFHRKRLDAIGSPVRLPKLCHANLAVPVHLKGGIILPDESVSNSIGAFCVRVPCERKHNQSCEERLKQVHRELSYVKKLPSAFLAHYIAKLSVHVLPRSWVSFFYSRAGAGSSCVVTNVRGLDQPVHMHGSKLESVYGFVPLPPGIPIGLVVSSYNRQVRLTLTAQPWAVPDADLFLSWILEEYIMMVQEAKMKESRKSRS